MIRCRGPDDRDELLGGEFALLIQIFQLGELAPGAEEDFQIRLGHVHVAGRDIHDQRMRRPALTRSGARMLFRSGGGLIWPRSFWRSTSRTSRSTSPRSSTEVPCAII